MSAIEVVIVIYNSDVLAQQEDSMGDWQLGLAHLDIVSCGYGDHPRPVYRSQP